MTLVSRYRDYVRQDNRLAESSNAIAMMVALSQPFYPLYVWWIIGSDAWVTLFTFLSTPLFFAVPALSRFNGLAARALLPLTGIANTTLVAVLLSPQSGAQLFLFPCLVIATLQFRRHERWAAYAIVTIAGAAYLAAPSVASVTSLPASQASRLVTLHAVGAATLTVLAGLWFWDSIANEASVTGTTPRRRDSPRSPRLR